MCDTFKAEKCRKVKTMMNPFFFSIGIFGIRPGRNGCLSDVSIQGIVDQNNQAELCVVILV